jgi:RsiW-degrading membrane proteinase PrsW (M82 family)
MVVELVLIFLGAVAAGVLVGMNADASVGLRQFYQEMTRSMGDAARLQTLILPLLANPWVILATLVCFAVVVPLLEELIKPLAVWALLGLGASPADGLVLGAIAGAGFGLTETLFSLSNVDGQAQWLALVVGRTGTNLLHVTTTALIGWGLVSAWRSRKFARLGLAYLCAVLLHGLWNTFSLVSALAGIWLPSQPLGVLLSYAALAGLLGLGGVCLGLLFGANRRLRAAPVLSGFTPHDQTPTL